MTDFSPSPSLLGPIDLAEKLYISISSEKILEIEKDTPDNLKDIAHYAAAWGVADDGFRREFIAKACEYVKQNLKSIVSSREDELDQWLAGPEASSGNFTAAYIAFSNMRMASDEIIL